MPAAHPPEFRRRALDFVAQGNPVVQTVRDLGISKSCLRNWMNRDAVDSGRKAGITTDEHKELVELRRRNRALEMAKPSGKPGQVPIVEWRVPSGSIASTNDESSPIPPSSSIGIYGRHDARHSRVLKRLRPSVAIDARMRSGEDVSAVVRAP
ncbi:hypothetical protein OH146_01580 [Salinibacterium sp. SYSU T00001]|uniref:transposase n=1 Tax=Homoserinimonas sedimenticola TaxID=2986805 RepID=UPI0022364437|nr:transposase [Salinibacterium sedimenticola]MCW4384460.1 hypothetical protein [Salinibacterium sedimenticola]